MRKQIEKGETAEMVLKEILGFEEVNKFTNLSKAQIIEQMAMLKYRSFSFENKKQKNNKPLHTLLMAIVSIGCGCLGETDSIARGKLASYKRIITKEGTDGSKF